MTIWRSQWRVALALLPLFVNFSTSLLDDRPVLEVNDGNLFITSAKDKNITLKTIGASYINVNGMNLVHVASSAHDASLLVEQWKSGYLANMESTLQRLTETIEGSDGLKNILNTIMQGTYTNTTMIMPQPLNTNGKDVVTRIRHLESRVHQLEEENLEFRRKLSTDECVSNPCQNGGTCEDRIDGYKCICPQGWEGPECNIDIDECASFAGTDLGCQNQATCLNLRGTYHCSCKSGWFGIHCTKRSMDCNNEDSKELCGHGVCVNKPGSLLGYICICDQGWESDGTNPACIKDVNECAGNHPQCSVNPLVTCINVDGSYRCGSCPQGYTGNGHYCSDIDECAIDNGGCSTSPLVKCTNTVGSRTCASCPVGYEGDGITCNYVGPCKLNNGGCHPLARCINNPGMSDSVVQCQCQRGYQGDGMGPTGCTVIDIGQSACTSNPCSYGTCTPNGLHDYVCQCAIGYTGKNCDAQINPCDSSPCENGGTCIVSNTRTPICQCTSNFHGERCATPREECGGLLTDPIGTLQFPHNNITYTHDLTCAWILSTNVSRVLNITFTVFNLEESTDCLYDFLQIQDGRSLGTQLIGRFCGNRLPNGGNIISSQNHLYLWFHSDHSLSSGGFTMQWNSTEPVCGGELNVDAGMITSPGSPGRYPPNRDCRWHVNVGPGKRIRFNFFAMMIEEHPTCQKDYLEIKDGPSVNSAQLGIYCNHTHPPSLFSPGSEAWIHFHSDSSGQDAGFQMTFTSVSGTPGCGGTYTASSGNIGTPRVGSTYEGNMDCEWYIQIKMGERIRVTWISFDLQDSLTCGYDFVEIYDGANREAPLLGRYCGNKLPNSISSTTNTLLIRFKSNWIVNKAGFRLRYEVLCGGEFTDESGIIKSIYYPNAYEASKICIYDIIQPPGKAIVLTIRDLDIERPRFARNCWYTYLEIRDGDSENSTKIGKYCGSNSSIPKFPIISTHNHMWLKFRTATYVDTHRGFMATYTTVDRRCGGIFKTPTGTIQPPIVNEQYGNDEDCTWIIQAPPGFIIELRWLEFHLESHSTCLFDYVKISENTSSTTQHDLGKYCGATIPPIMTTQSRIMTIHFHTDEHVTKDGFTAAYTFINNSKTCGGHFHAATGVIMSPNYPDTYPQHRLCEWIINAPNKHQVVLRVKKFNIEGNSPCIHDYLEIRNGGTETSPTIGKYCGTKINKEIKSFGNKIYLKFVSNSWSGGEGFNIEWNSNTIGCGGILNTANGSIISPNYPQPYGHELDCNWKIRVSAGSVVKLVIVDLQLEEGEKCVSDFIEIYDGPNRLNKNLGRYCNHYHPLSIQTTSNTASIRFRSDYDRFNRGFHITYSTVCNATLRGFRGVIESPNFPNDYPARTNCTWIIEAPVGNTLNLTFSHFDLEAAGADSCSNDYLSIMEGTHYETSREIVRLCNSLSVMPKIASTQRQVFLQFYSNNYLTRNGFRLEWVVNGCGGLLTQSEGTITSPGYPYPYRENIECEWNIEVDYFHSIEITLTQAQVQHTDCMYNHFTIHNGADDSAPKLLTICQIDRPVTLTSTGHKMFIKYYSKKNTNNAGFKAVYKSVGIRCGGNFTALTGVIHSPNYPLNYLPNQNCEWFIRVLPNHVVNFTFEDFDIADRKNCTANYVKLYDGSSRAALELGTYCHNTLPSSHISSGNELLVVMRTNDYETAKGFQATFHTACGARIVTNDQGSLATDVNVGRDRLEKNCTWIIVAQDPEDHVTLTFTHFQIYTYLWASTTCPFGTVQVFEGEGTDGPLLGTWCGTKVPPPIISQGNALTVNAAAKYILPYVTFTGIYSVLNSACGGDYMSYHGTIATPGYPNNYPRNIECIWILRTTPGSSISLSFKEFDLVESENCDVDYLEVREGDGIGELRGIYCGQNMNPITSFNNLWIKFKSGADETKKGFAADYSLLPGADLSGASGEIASPLYPTRFKIPKAHRWRITVDSMSTIQITWKKFDVEQLYAACFTFITIYDGYNENAPKLFNGCGYIPPETMRSTSNAVYIVFSIGSPIYGSSFLLSWLQVPRDEHEVIPHTGDIECGETILMMEPNINYSTFHSPGWPMGYDINLNCNWIFKSSPGTHLSLKFIDMDLEETTGCSTDQVTIFSGNPENSQDEWSDIGNFCYKNATDILPIETTNLMKVNLHTDVSRNQTGFKAKVAKVCGGQLFGPNGVIHVNRSTFGNPFNNTGIRDCQWNITVRQGRTIAVEIVDLNIGSTTDGTICGDSYLMLKNGGSASSPLLGTGKYCGNVKPKDGLETAGNQLYARVYGDIDTTQFLLVYREVGLDCGGQFILTQELSQLSINTTNYPNIPSPHSECFWTIMAPAGEQIMINFIDRFDLTSSETCDREYVEIRDGGTDSSLLMGRFCGSQAPNTMTTTGNVMYIHFYTDVPDPKNGFKALINIGDYCDRVVRASEGVIRSPNYPSDYPVNITCRWYISGPPNHLVKLQFQDLDLRSHGSCQDDDYINIIEKIQFNENTDLAVRNLGSYCGTSKPGVIETLGNQVVVVFKSDDKPSIGFRGFSINFTTTLEACGGDLTATTAEFSSPGYPYIQSRPRYCQWKITVPRGYRIQLEIVGLHLGTDTSVSDPLRRVAFQIFNDLDRQSMIADINNSDAHKTFFSTSNTMGIRYWSDSTPCKGFKVRYNSVVPPLCGGTINDEEGTLVSKQNIIFNITTFYCEWDVYAPLKEPTSQTVALTVSGDLGNSDPLSTTDTCLKLPFNKIIVRTSTTSIISYLCGKLLKPYTIRSPYPVNTVTIERPRWTNKANYSINYRWHRCGGILGGPSHTISSPANQTSTIDCVWHAKFPNSGQLISLTFEKIHLGRCDRNYIIVRKGGGMSPHAGTYCETSISGSNITSSSNELWIEYHGEDPSNDFRIKLNTVQAGCGGKLDNTALSISSPSFPNEYPSNLECTWTLEATPGEHIGLYFIDRFHLESSTNCSNDFIQILDWKQDTDTGESKWLELAKVCGRVTPGLFNSTSNFMKIVFRSNGDIQGSGFHAQWEKNCGGTFVVTKKKSALISPEYRQFEKPRICNYTFLAPGKTIVVKFTDVSLSSADLSNCQGSSILLTHSNMGSAESTLFKGDNRPPIQRVTSRLDMQFSANTCDYSSFSLEYYLDQCGGAITSPADISSPSFDDSANSYAISSNCTWIITAPPGEAVLLRFERFNIQSRMLCYSNFVAVYSGLSIDSQNRRALLCGNLTNSLPVIKSENGTMVLNFISYQSSTSDGFNAKILFTAGAAAGCGGEIELSQSETFKTQKGSTYGALLDCHWVIRAPFNNVIKLNITSMDLKNANTTTGDNKTKSCTAGDYLEIRDGASPLAELIEIYCGNSTPLPIISSSNTLWLRLVTDETLNGTGVIATLDILASPCGNPILTITKQTQVLTSPGFPGPYNAGLRCRWQIRSPDMWSRFMIRFIQFNLEDSEYCSEDALSINPEGSKAHITEGLGEDFVFSGISGHQRSVEYIASRVLFHSYSYCGNATPPDYYSYGDMIEISFKSSQHPKATHTGFKIEYSYTVCAQNFTSMQGRIIQEQTKNCWFTITAPVGHTISLYFSRFSISDRNDVLYENCTANALQIRDGNFSDSILAQLCGTTIPNPIFSSGRKLSLHLWAEQDNRFKTYDLTYTTTDKGKGCGGKIYNYVGRFTSPLYPGQYRHDGHCTWEVSVPIGFIVKLRFTVFDIGVRGTCATDYLQISDLRDDQDNASSITYCGEDNPANYHSTSNRVLVKYHTSMNNGGMGWIIDFMAEHHE